METRIQRIFLVASVLSALSFFHSSVFAATETTKNDEGELGKIITPDLERRHIKEADVDTEDFEMGLYYGLFSMEDFGTNPVQGMSFTYHITENFFTQMNYAITQTQKTSYELLSNTVELLTPEERDLSYYNISLGYNVLPGQVYLTKKWHFNSSGYVVLGAGNTQFASSDYFTYTLGAGYKLYATDWLLMDVSMRNYSFTHNLFGVDKKTNNLETRFAVSIFL
jgi:outer membrane beta-barrel protein